MSNATEMSTNTTEAPACGGLSEDVYDQPYHIGAVFILFAVSLAGTAIPFAIQRFGTPGNPAVDICHRIGMAFGTGVVLATAFIHMLPPAQAALTSPCVAEWFKTNLEYPWAPLIAMVTILVLHGIEYTTQVFMEQRFHTKQEKAAKTPVVATTPSEPIEPKEGESATTIPPTTITSQEKEHGEEGHEHTGACAGATTDLWKQSEGGLQERVGLVILELGIAMHSILIGLALGVAAGDTFVPLLIALVFHQFFEGFGLGSACVSSGVVSIWAHAGIMAWYSLSTPLGVAIGIGMHSTFSETNSESLVAQGVLDSVSFGILLYSAIVELMSNHMILDKKLRAQSLVLQFSTFISLYLGVIAMAIIGKYA